MVTQNVIMQRSNILNLLHGTESLLVPSDENNRVDWQKLPIFQRAEGVKESLRDFLKF